MPEIIKLSQKELNQVSVIKQGGELDLIYKQ